MDLFDLDDVFLYVCDIDCKSAFEPYREDYAKYINKYMRVESFAEKGNINSKYSPRAFAKAGLFRTGEADECACFHCGNLICGWEYDDDPMEQHAKRSLRCDFVNSRRQLEMRVEDRRLQIRQRFFDSFLRPVDFSVTYISKVREMTGRETIPEKMQNSFPHYSEAKLADRNMKVLKVNRYESISSSARKMPVRNTVPYVLDKHDDSEEKVVYRTETDGKVVQAEDKWPGGSVEVVKIKWPTVLPERSIILGADGFYLDQKLRKIGDEFDSGPGQGGGYKFAKSAMTEGEMFMEGTVFNYRSDVIIKSGMNEAPYGIQICQTESSCKSAEHSRDGYIWDLFGSSTLQKIRADPDVLCDNYWKDQTGVPLGDVVADSAPKQSGPYDKDTEEEIRALEQLLMCKVCLGKDSCIVFFPCRHMATCDACERFLQRCPVCRSAIDEAVKINEE